MLKSKILPLSFLVTFLILFFFFFLKNRRFRRSLLLAFTFATISFTPIQVNAGQPSSSTNQVEQVNTGQSSSSTHQVQAGFSVITKNSRPAASRQISNMVLSGSNSASSPSGSGSDDPNGKDDLLMSSFNEPISKSENRLQMMNQYKNELMGIKKAKTTKLKTTKPTREQREIERKKIKSKKIYQEKQFELR